MQILYLSNRPDVMAETLRQVRRLMPWVTQAVIVVPERVAEVFDLDGLGETLVVTDEEVSGLSSAEIANLDHVRRNVTLRRALIAGTHLNVVDDVFILSDDDYRPLRPIDESFYTSPDGDRGFYCYDLASWPGDSTDFDEAQHATREALALLGGSQLSFGSHMPQIMRKAIWEDVFEQFSQLTDDSMVCEWTLYFNLGPERHGTQFAEPTPFETLCWPQYPNEWPWWVAPRRYSFENFYPELYQPGHLFAGLDSSPQEGNELATSYAKLRAWSTFARSSAKLDFSGGVDNPWTGTSPVRKTTFGVLKHLRKAYDYLSLEDRAAITELSGEVSRLADLLAKRDRP